jgi:hypothetical protein
VFLAVFAVRFCVAKINLRDSVTNIAEVGWKSDCCFYRQCFQLVFVVVCVDKDMADGWSMKEVVKRWHQLYQGPLLSQKYQRGDKLSKGECISLDETVMIYRQRLYDISWLMRNLNEYIAREANKEDGCTGRFYSLPSMALTLRAS